MLSCYFSTLGLGGVLTSPQAAPSGLQMTPPSLPGTENPGKPGSPDFLYYTYFIEPTLYTYGVSRKQVYKLLFLRFYKLSSACRGKNEKERERERERKERGRTNRKKDRNEKYRNNESATLSSIYYQMIPKSVW